jgi:hypothetical protein
MQEKISFEKPEYRKIKSLFFTSAEVTDIKLALNTYKKHFSGATEDADFNEEDFLNQLAGLRRSPKTNRYFVYPQFFLDSIVYHGKDNWTVWINGQKYTNSTANEASEIRIAEIDKDKAIIEWKPVAMDKVNAVWDRMPNDEVVVDKQRGLVDFVLRPNQTFSSYVMRVVEGRVQTVTVDNTIVDVAEETAADTEQGAGAGEPAQADRPKEGLGGLIDAYSKLGTSNDAMQQPTPTAAPSPTMQEKKP